MTFITDNFLLQNATAEELYHQYARTLPIIDYHCHLPPADIAANRQFADLQEIWLEGDHYKWRAMRANGIEEDRITGDASGKEKFLAFAETLPHCLRNPLYHWCHLELKRYFGIDTLLGPKTAEGIWEAANAALMDPAMRACGILERFKVSVVCTTDDPVDDLEHHRTIAASGIGTRVYPTFRPDKAMVLTDITAWNVWVDKLAQAADTDCASLDGMKAALRKRHDTFHALGGRLSDHGLEVCPAQPATDRVAGDIFTKARRGEPVSPADAEAFAAHLLEYFAELDAEKGWTKQLHLGAVRNVNAALYRALGPDVGGDSIGDARQGAALGETLGRFASKGILPRMVLYNLNPRDNYVFASMAGNFQGDGIPGKIQFGSGWWFLDQKEGMTWQLNALSNLGLLGRFVGMLTDSRSFMSYCRHEYFRRLLCQLIGDDVEKGELPADMALLGDLVTAVCHGNAARFFGLELGRYQD
ncbi:MAG: glucuronate isomerase [Verrucomicrobiota bacterium]|jgi:glucuronate isomerase